MTRIWRQVYICPFIFRCDALDRLKQKCSTLEQEIRDPVRFKDFYQFTFNYAKNPGQKGLGETSFCKITINFEKWQMWGLFC